MSCDTKMKKNLSVFILVLWILCGLCGFSCDLSNVYATDSSTTINEAFIIRVAVYNGSGAGRDSSLAQVKMYEWMGCEVTTITGQDILDGCLDNFDLLGYPGGHYPAFWEIGQEGKRKIQDFVRSGGGYLGICAGAWWACDYMVWMDDPNYPPPEYHVEGDESNLDFFPGVAQGPIEEITPYRTGKMTEITFVDRTHPITNSIPEHLTVLYYGGPHLLPYNGANVSVLATFDVTDTPAIVALEYGKGRVFLCSPHAEIEEDSDRDGRPLSFNIKLDFTDPESDWPLFLEAVKWLTMRSTLSRMEELTDSYRSSEVQDLISKISDLEDEMQRQSESVNAKLEALETQIQIIQVALEDKLDNLSNSVMSLEEDNAELGEQLSYVQETQTQERATPSNMTYIISGISLCISIVAVILCFLRTRD